MFYNEIYPFIDLKAVVLNGRRKTDYIIKERSFLELIPAETKYVAFEERFDLPSNWSADIVDGRVVFLDEKSNYKGCYDLPMVYDNQGVSQRTLSKEDIQNSLVEDIVHFNLIKEGNSYILQTKVLI